MKDWKNAEHDLLVTMPIDLTESEGHFYALATVPGYAAAEIRCDAQRRGACEWFAGGTDGEGGRWPHDSLGFGTT